MDLHSEGRTGEPPVGSSAGAWLKAARQQRGLHIAALAVMLKVPQAKLEAIEADRWDELPDATFARALATAMCRALKLDPAPVLALLPRSVERELDVSTGLNQPFRERAAAADGVALSTLGRPVVWGSVLLLVAAAVVYFLPAGWLPGSEPSTGKPEVAASEPAPMPVLAASAPLESQGQSQSLAEPAASGLAPSQVQIQVQSSPASAAASAVPSPAPVPAAVPVTAVASAPLQVREVPPPPSAAASGPPVKVIAHSDTWVEVVDAQGQLQFSRVIPAGQSREITGLLPLKVRVGNVTGARVEWRGATVDLASKAKDNIARVELK